MITIGFVEVSDRRRKANLDAINPDIIGREIYNTDNVYDCNYYISYYIPKLYIYIYQLLL